jgi:hypothetical protein
VVIKTKDLNQIQEQNPVIVIVIEKKYSSHHGKHKNIMSIFGNNQKTLSRLNH